MEKHLKSIIMSAQNDKNEEGNHMKKNISSIAPHIAFRETLKTRKKASHEEATSLATNLPRAVALLVDRYVTRLKNGTIDRRGLELTNENFFDTYCGGKENFKDSWWERFKIRREVARLLQIHILRVSINRLFLLGWYDEYYCAGWYIKIR